ncbi:hypothetical protein NQZ68_022435, partial [Dissostichus eleginoides]
SASHQISSGSRKSVSLWHIHPMPHRTEILGRNDQSDGNTSFIQWEAADAPSGDRHYEPFRWHEKETLQLKFVLFHLCEAHETMDSPAGTAADSEGSSLHRKLEERRPEGILK